MATVLLPLVFVGNLKAQEPEAKPEKQAVAVSPTNGNDSKPDNIHGDDPRHIKDDAIARAKWFAERYGEATPEYLDHRMALAEKEIEKWGRMIPGTVAYKAYKKLEAENAARGIVKAGLPEKTWVNIGPWSGLNSGQASGDVNVVDTGRITVILPHPTKPNVLYVGYAGGGLWRCQNAYLDTDDDWVWEPMTDGLPSGGNLPIGGAAFKPEDPNTIYISLGDAIHSMTADGRGFFISNDGGETWRKGGSLGSTTRTKTVLALPGNIVLVAGNDGLYRSTNGGTSFTRLDLGLDGQLVGGARISHSCWDTLRLDDGSLIMSSSPRFNGPNGGLIYYSTNNGATWTKATITGFPSGTETGRRISIAASGNTLHGLYFIEGEAKFPRALIKSTDGGRSWFYQAAPTLYSYADGDGGQLAYNQMIAVDPDDPDTVFVGTNLTLQRSVDGGRSFDAMAHWLAQGRQYIHADIHVHSWAPTGRKALYLGTDGGLSIVKQPNINPIPAVAGYMASDPAFIDHRRNKNIATQLVYNISSTTAATPTGSRDEVIIGMQDLGTRLRTESDVTNGAYDRVIGGDGLGCVIHPYNGNMMLGTTQGGGIYRSVDRSKFFWYTGDGIDANENTSFFTPLVHTMADPTGNRVYTFTNQRPYVSDSFGMNWSPLPTTGNGWPSNADIITFMASPQKLGLLGAIAVSRNSGGYYLCFSENNGATWRASDIRYSFNETGINWPNGLAFDTHNSDIVYVFSARFRSRRIAGYPHSLAKSTDGGRTFFPIDGSNGFPSGALIHTVKVDPLDNNVVYAGTDLGLYRTTNQGATWSRFGHGLPLVSVTDIYIAPDASFMRIGTFGRGVWEMEGVTDSYAPRIIAQPAGLLEDGIGRITFSVGAVGIPAPTYQWQSSTNGSVWANISDATDRVYTETNYDSDKRFRVIATNPRGSVTSNTATTSVATMVRVSPEAVKMYPGDTQTFTATVSGLNNKNVTWELRYLTGGATPTITPNGNQCIFEAKGNITVLLIARSVENNTVFGEVLIAVESGISIVDSPKGLMTGDTATFTARVMGLSNTAITWEVSAGTINPTTGAYTAPPTAQTVTITATSAENPSIKTSAFVKISGTDFDGNTSKNPQLMSFAFAYGSTRQADLDKYDFNGDGKIDEEDLKMLVKKMGW
ncbi:MAG: hypothetical protein FWG12_01120 [Holophagaceae bacterium]|nr:hypothetical protein [Holophagaceae bacterium]